MSKGRLSAGGAAALFFRPRGLRVSLMAAPSALPSPDPGAPVYIAGPSGSRSSPLPPRITPWTGRLLSDSCGHAIFPALSNLSRFRPRGWTVHPAEDLLKRELGKSPSHLMWGCFRQLSSRVLESSSQRNLSGE